MDRDKLLGMTKEQLVRLVEISIEGQTASTKNMQSLVAMMKRMEGEMKQLRDEKATQEAELIVLRNRPC
jgi:peptidoglycan hydrolase CwlO-like protein